MKISAVITVNPPRASVLPTYHQVFWSNHVKPDFLRWNKCQPVDSPAINSWSILICSQKSPHCHISSSYAMDLWYCWWFRNPAFTSWYGEYPIAYRALLSHGFSPNLAWYLSDSPKVAEIIAIFWSFRNAIYGISHGMFSFKMIP